VAGLLAVLLFPLWSCRQHPDPASVCRCPARDIGRFLACNVEIATLCFAQFSLHSRLTMVTKRMQFGTPEVIASAVRGRDSERVSIASICFRIVPSTPSSLHYGNKRMQFGTLEVIACAVKGRNSEGISITSVCFKTSCTMVSQRLAAVQVFTAVNHATNLTELTSLFLMSLPEDHMLHTP